MIEVGRVCVKLAGRDAGLKCVIIDVLDDKFVMIDGETRRRKCNIRHIEPLDQMMKIKKNASHIDIVSEFKSLGIDLKEEEKKAKAEKKQKPKKAKVMKRSAGSEKPKAEKKKVEKKTKK